MGMQILEPSSGWPGGAAPPSQLSIPGWVNVLDFGAVPDGVTDNTAAYTAAMTALGAAGGTVIIPQGNYVGNIRVPNPPISPNFGGISILGAGYGTTQLMPATANTPLITKLERTGVIDGVSMGGFTILAHPAGSTGPAIDFVGYRASLIHDLGFLSNGTGTFDSLIHQSSGQMLCFSNHITRVVITNQLGPTRVFLYDNKDDAGVPQSSGGVELTANNTHISHCFVNAGTGITTVVDGEHSANTSIEYCFFEGDGAAVWVTVGQGMNISGNHFECDAVGGLPDLIVFSNLSNDAFFHSNDYSGLTALTIGNGIRNIRMENDLFYAGSFGNTVITDNGLNNKITVGRKYVVAPPSFANNAAALAGGLTAGMEYTVTGSDPLQLAVVF